MVGSRTMKSEVEDRLRGESFLDIDHSKIAISGFPNRFDITVFDPVVADPRSGLRWEAPFFQILSLSYDWAHLIAVWPPTQSFAFPDDAFTVHSDGMKASVVYDLRPDFKPERIAFETGEARILNENRLIASVSGMVFAAERVGPDLYRIGISVPEAEIAQANKFGLQFDSDTPFNVSNLVGDLRVKFGSPPRFNDLRTLESRISEISIDRLNANLNGLYVSVAGKLEFSVSGYPVGEMSIELENPDVLVDIAIASGIVAKDRADSVLFAISLLSLMGSDSGAIRIPLQFKDGLAFLAGIAIGPAWRLAKE